jgi:hypothetical protein
MASLRSAFIMGFLSYPTDMIDGNFFHPTFCPVSLPPLLQVFLEAESVVVAELSPEVVVLVVEPEVVFVVDLEVSEPGVVFVAVVSTADVAEPQVSVDIPVVFDVLIPVFVVVVVDLDSSGHPKFFAFPNVDYYASSSSSVELVGQESVHSSIDVHANYGLCSILSNPGLHQNKNLEHRYNNPSPGYSNVNDTNDPPIDATTNHSRKTDRHLYLEQRKHRSYQESLLPLVVREI